MSQFNFPDEEDDVSGRPDSNLPISDSEPAVSAFNFPASVSTSEGGLITSRAGLGQEEDRAPTTVLGSAVDLLSRGQFASTAFVDEIMQGDGEGFALGSALSAAASELVAPEKRLSYRDILFESSPIWASNNPQSANLLGFLGDVFLDPTTYLTFGTGTATRMIASSGRVVLRESAEASATEGIARIATRTVKAKQREVALNRAGEALYKTVLDRKAAKGLEGKALRESAERTVGRVLAGSNADRFIDPGTVKFLGRTIGGSAQESLVRSVKSSLHLDKAAGALSSLPGAAALSKTLDAVGDAISRNRGLGHEYVSVRQHLEAEMHALGQAVEQDTTRIFATLNKESREKIGRLSLEIDDASRALKSKNKALSPERGRALADQKILGSDLTPQEFAAFSTLRRRYEEIGEAEVQAGLLKHLLVNYTPRRYEAIADGKGFTTLRRMWAKGLSTNYTAKQQRTFKSIAEAQKAGFSPVTDAAVLYGQRLLESRQALARDTFDKAVKTLFPKGPPPRVSRDITYVGESLYSRGALPESNTLLAAYDGVLSFFRTGATVARPGFASRQAVSNLGQSFLNAGIKVFGVLDPRVANDAALILAGKPGKLTIKSNLGHTYSGEEVLELAKSFGVLRGTAIDGVSTSAGGTRLARALADDIDKLQKISKATGQKKGAESGLAKFLLGASRYMEFPAKIEDFARVSTFMTGLRIGHAPEAAARLTDRALFDYSNGLSAFEARFARRLVPFYSFQRFAIPMLIRATAQNPGRIVNTTKAAEALFNAWNIYHEGGVLTESERAAVPGWLLEQPSTFERVDEEQKAVFRTLVNFSPLDTFSILATGNEGELDVEQSLINASLSQLTPFIKIPIEVAARKNFFTEQALPEDFRSASKSVGPLDPDLLIRNIATLVGAQATKNVVGAVAGNLLGRVITYDNSEDQEPTDPDAPGVGVSALKRAFGWEEGVDPATGQRQVYVNPFLMMLYSGINPALNDALKSSREDRTALETTSQWLFGVGTQKLDLQRERSNKLRNLAQEKKRLIGVARRAAREERLTAYDLALEDVTEFVKQMQSEVDLLEKDSVRGTFDGS